jgi:hypothetical protein
MYYFHFLGYVQVFWLDMVAPTRTGMQVLIHYNHLVFYIYKKEWEFVSISSLFW